MFRFAFTATLALLIGWAWSAEAPAQFKNGPGPNGGKNGPGPNGGKNGPGPNGGKNGPDTHPPGNNPPWHTSGSPGFPGPNGVWKKKIVIVRPGVGGGPIIGGPVVVGGPAVIANGVPFQGVGLTLFNSRNNTAPVSFVVGGRTYTLNPGYEVALDSQPSWTLTFNRGANLGEASYDIVDGKTYGFSVSAMTGWELYEEGPAVADAAPPVPANPTPAPANPIPAGPNVTPVANAPALGPTPNVVPTGGEPAPAGVPKAVEAFAAVRKGDFVVVVPAEVEVRSGAQVLAKVLRNQALKVHDVQGAWLLVDVDQPEYGWIHRRNVRVRPNVEEAPPGVVPAAGASRGVDR